MEEQTIDFENISATEHLFKSLYPVMCSIADHYVNDETLSEDIAQEAFIKLWDKKEILHDISSIKSYLYIMVRNLSIDYLRNTKNKIVPLEVFPQRHLSNEEENELINEEVIALLYHAINTLPPQSSKIILLLLEGLGNKEIAEKLKISINSVKTLKYNALKSLRTKLGDDLALILFTLIGEKL